MSARWVSRTVVVPVLLAPGPVLAVAAGGHAVVRVDAGVVLPDQPAVEHVREGHLVAELARHDARIPEAPNGHPRHCVVPPLSVPREHCHPNLRCQLCRIAPGTDRIDRTVLVLRVGSGRGVTVEAEANLERRVVEGAELPKTSSNVPKISQKCALSIAKFP